MGKRCYSSYKAREMNKRENDLSNKLKTIEECIDRSEKDDSDIIRLQREYAEIKEDIEEINDYRAKGHIIRSKANYIENDEKSTKFFLQLENRNCKAKHVRSLLVNNTLITEPKAVLKEQLQFYEKLYKEDSDNACHSNCKFFQSQGPHLSESDKTKCDKVITLEECIACVRELPNNKTPGSDGFNSEFYKFFWGKIKKLVHNSFIHSFESGELSIDQKRAILTLLPKPNKDT